MKSYKIVRYIVFAVIGAIVFGAGLAFLLLFPEMNRTLKIFSYLCVGIGAGILGGNTGTAVRNGTILKNPQLAKRVEIEEKDERNQSIINKAKSRAYDLMLFAYAAILLAFALMQVDMYVVLTLVAVYLFIVFSNVYYLSKYQKEM
jgi:hypothetical protein